MYIKIKPAALWIMFSIALIFATGYFYFHLRMTTPLGDIEVEEKVERTSKDNSSRPAHGLLPGDDLPDDELAINVSAAYQSQGSLKTYIVSQNKNKVTFFESHPVFGNIKVGNGVIEGGEIISDFFSSEAYDHHAPNTSGTLHLRYNKFDRSLRGSFFVGNKKQEDVILLPQN